MRPVQRRARAEAGAEILDGDLSGRIRRTVVHEACHRLALAHAHVRRRSGAATQVFMRRPGLGELAECRALRVDRSRQRTPLVPIQGLLREKGRMLKPFTALATATIFSATAAASAAATAAAARPTIKLACIDPLSGRQGTHETRPSCAAHRAGAARHRGRREKVAVAGAAEECAGPRRPEVRFGRRPGAHVRRIPQLLPPWVANTIAPVDGKSAKVGWESANYGFRTDAPGTGNEEFSRMERPPGTTCLRALPSRDCPAYLPLQATRPCAGTNWQALMRQLRSRCLSIRYSASQSMPCPSVRCTPCSSVPSASSGFRNATVSWR